MARIAHKVRAPRSPKPVQIDSGYQAEVDRSTQRLERRYARTQRAVEQARFRRDRTALIVGQGKLRAQRLAEADAALAAREAELREIEHLMRANPYASLAHRGRDGWTKVPR